MADHAAPRAPTMTDAQIIVLATPVFFGLIAIELAVGHWRGRNTLPAPRRDDQHRTGHAQPIGGPVHPALRHRPVQRGVHRAGADRLPTDAWWVWSPACCSTTCAITGSTGLGHRVALLWAAHVVHHQSEDYNLDRAAPDQQRLAAQLAVLPADGALGFPPLVFGVLAMIDLLYQYWVHTQQIGRLGWFDAGSARRRTTACTTPSTTVMSTRTTAAS